MRHCALRWWLFKVIMLYLPGSGAYGIPCCRHLRTLILTIFKKKIRSLDHLGPNAGEPWVLNNPFWPNSVMIGTEEFWYDFFHSYVICEIQTQSNEGAILMDLQIDVFPDFRTFAMLHLMMINDNLAQVLTQFVNSVQGRWGTKTSQPKLRYYVLRSKVSFLFWFLISDAIEKKTWQTVVCP